MMLSAEKNGTEDRAAIDEGRRESLLCDGFCVFPQQLPAHLLARLRETTDALLSQQSAEERTRHRAQGSMLPVTVDPLFAELIALPEARECLKALGWDHPTYTDGYVISKPGGSPRLFWHYDWFAWEDPSAYAPEPPQLFLMWYLSDTTPENGCLRVVPGSHITHNALHDRLGEPHSRALSDARDHDAPEFSDRPDEVDVPIHAGDLLIGDARLLHASHANVSGGQRTLITLWYQPNFSALPERVQAQIAAKAQTIPTDWPPEARASVEALLPQYAGNAEPYGRTLYRRQAR